jgi:hypothetical protein
VAFVALAAAVLGGDRTVLRAAAALAAVGGLVGAALLYQRGHAGELAESALAEETGLRLRQQAEAEERAAELENASEQAHEQVARLNQRLLALRAQLTYSERENARLLGTTAALAAERALSVPGTPRAERAGRRPGPEGAEVHGAAADDTSAYPPAPPAAATGPLPGYAGGLGGMAPKRAADRPADGVSGDAPDGAASAADWARAALPPLRPASAVVPPQRGRPRREPLAESDPAFSFFSREEGAAEGRAGGRPAVEQHRRSSAPGPGPDEDDPLTAEAWAAQQAYSSVPEPVEDAPSAESEGVYDLTAEDETENTDVRGLRASG